MTGSSMNQIKAPAGAVIARVTIVLDDTDGPIRRTVEVPGGITLADLHLVIQAAMGWTNSHLYEFTRGRDRFGLPEPGWRRWPGERPVRAAATTGLAEVADLSNPRKKARLSYVYDFGDGWEHSIEVTSGGTAVPNTAYPRLVEAVGRCPPEDVGGVPGFYDFLEAMADENSPEHEDRLDWYGGPFDPRDAGEQGLRADLAKLAARFARRDVKATTKKTGDAKLPTNKPKTKQRASRPTSRGAP